MNHEHDHDENCGCGCHNGHHDHLDNSTQAEPHHHPSHLITVKTHDTSLVGSYQFDIESPYEEALIILDALLKQLSQEVIALDGLIGHIKAFLTSEGNSCMISITEDESDKHPLIGSRCHVDGVAIIFSIQPDQLEAILYRVLSPYLNT